MNKYRVVLLHGNRTATLIVFAKDADELAKTMETFLTPAARCVFTEIITEKPPVPF